MNLIKRLKDDKIFKVTRYFDGSDGNEHIYCDDWEGHHIIGKDCEWVTIEETIEDLYKKASKYKGLLLSYMRENNIQELDVTEGSFYTTEGLKVYTISVSGMMNIRLRGLVNMMDIEDITLFKRILNDVKRKDTVIKINEI